MASYNDIRSKYPQIADMLDAGHIKNRVKFIEETGQKTKSQMDALKELTRSVEKNAENSIGHLLNDINGVLGRLPGNFVPDYSYNKRTGELVVHYYPNGDKNYYSTHGGEAPFIKLSADENGAIVHNGISVANMWVPDRGDFGELQLLTTLEFGLKELRDKIVSTSFQNAVKKIGSDSGAVATAISGAIRQASNKAFQAASSVNTNQAKKDYSGNRELTKGNKFNNAAAMGKFTLDHYIEQVVTDNVVQIINGNLGVGNVSKGFNKNRALNVVKKTFALYAHSASKEMFEAAAAEDEAVSRFIKSKEFQNAIEKEFKQLSSIGVKQGIISDSTAMDVGSFISPQRYLGFLSTDANARKVRAGNEVRSKNKNHSNKYAISKGRMMGASNTEKALGLNKENDARYDRYLVAEITQKDINDLYTQLKKKYIGTGKKYNNKEIKNLKDFEKVFGKNMEGIIEDALLYDQQIEREFDSEDIANRKVLKEEFDKKFKQNLEKRIAEEQKKKGGDLDPAEIHKIEEQVKKKVIAKEFKLKENDAIIDDIESFTDTGSGKEYYSATVRSKFGMRTGTKMVSGTTRAVAQSITPAFAKELSSKLGMDGVHIFREAKSKIEPKHIFETMVNYMQYLYDTAYSDNITGYAQELNKKFAAATGGRYSKNSPFNVDADGTLIFDPKYINSFKKHYVDFLAEIGDLDKHVEGNPFEKVIVDGKTELRKKRNLIFSAEMNQANIAHYGAADYKGGNVHFGAKERNAEARVHGELRGLGLDTTHLEKSSKELANKTDISKAEYDKYKNDYIKLRDVSQKKDILNINSESKKYDSQYASIIDATSFTEEQLEKLEYNSDGTINKESYKGSYLEELQKIKDKKYQDLVSTYGEEALRKVGINGADDVPIFIKTGEYGFVDSDGNTITGNTLRLGNYHLREDEETGDVRADTSVLDIRKLLQDSNSGKGSLYLGNKVYDYLEGQRHEIFDKEGGIFLAANRATVNASMMPTTISSNPEKFSGNLQNTLTTAKEDIFHMLGKKKEESGEQYLSRIKNIYQELFSEFKGDRSSTVDQWSSEILGNDKLSDTKKANKLLSIIQQAITYSDDEKSLYQQNGGKGIITKVHRYPSINGKDVHYVKTIIDPALQAGAVGGDPYLLKDMNADYDGDHLVITALMGDGTIYQTWTESEKEALLKEARQAEGIDAQRAARLAKMEQQSNSTAGGSEENYASQQDIDDDFSKELKTVFITKFNKTFTGSFDNTRYAIEEALRYGGVDETSIQSGDALSKENAVRSQIIRAVFEAMSQEAISAKKATLKKAYNEDGSENPKWWNGVERLYKEIKDPQNWLDPTKLDKLIDQMISLGILDDKDGSLFKNRIAAQIGSAAENETLESIFGKDIYDNNGNIDESKIKITKDVLKQSIAHIFGDKSGKGGAFRGFATVTDNYTQYIGGLGDVFKNQSSVLPGIGSQGKNFLPIAEREAYKKVIDQLTDSVNKERAAEEAKIAVAQKEGTAISNLTNNYASLDERLKDTKKILKENQGQYATTVSKHLDVVFPTGYEGSDDRGFRQNAANFLLSHPNMTPEQLRKVGYKGLGFDDQALFKKFVRGQEATTAGTIADSIDQALVYLNKNGKNVRTFEGILSLFGVGSIDELQKSLGISFADLNDTSAQGQLALQKKIETSSAYNKNQKQWLSNLFKNNEADHDEGLFSILGKNIPLWSLFYGKGDQSNLNKYIHAGEEQFITNSYLAGGNIDNLGPEEQQVLNGTTGKLIKGRLDTLTYGTEKDELGRDIDVINVIDKKYGKKMSSRYVGQIYDYIKGLEMAQKDIIDSNLSYEDWLDKSELGQWYSTHGGIDETLFEKLRNGAMIRGGINLINKSKGTAEFYHIGAQKQYRKTVNGKSYSNFRLSDNADINQLLEYYLDNGIPQDQWDPEAIKYFQGTYRQSQDPHLNRKVSKPEEEEKELKLTDLIKLYKEILELQRKINELEKEGTEEAENLSKVLNKEKKDKEKDLKQGKDNLSKEEKSEFNKEKKKLDIIDAYNNTGGENKEDKRNERELNSLWKQFVRTQVSMNRNRSEYAMTMDKSQRAALDEQYLYQGQELKGLYESIENLEKDLPPEKIKKIREEAEKFFNLSDANRKVQQHGQNNFWGQLSSQFARLTTNFIKFGAASRVLQTVRRDIQKVIQAAKELDKAMTNIRIVTQKSADDAKQLINEYSALASQIGVTTTEVATSANEWFNKKVEITHK